MKSLIRILCALLAAFALTGCSREPKKEDVMSVVVTDLTQDLSVLEEYPNLQAADLRGCRNYGQIMEYISLHPDVDVIYEVTIGVQTFAHDVTELILDPKTTTFESVLENVKFLPGVSRISLPETRFTAQEMDALKQAYPDIQITR